MNTLSEYIFASLGWFFSTLIAIAYVAGWRHSWQFINGLTSRIARPILRGLRRDLRRLTTSERIAKFGEAID